MKKGGRDDETRMMSLLTKAANQTSSTPPNPWHQRQMESCLRTAGHLESSDTYSSYLGLHTRTQYLLFWLQGMQRTALILITRFRHLTCVIIMIIYCKRSIVDVGKSEVGDVREREVGEVRERERKGM